MFTGIFKWSGRLDLNQRSLDPQSSDGGFSGQCLQGQNETAEKCVTQNVTHFPETSLVEVLRGLPREALLELLAEALKR